MDALKTMNEAINYIENHLTETVDFGEVASVGLKKKQLFMSWEKRQR